MQRGRALGGTGKTQGLGSRGDSTLLGLVSRGPILGSEKWSYYRALWAKHPGSMGETDGVEVSSEHQAGRVTVVGSRQFLYL